MTTTLASRFVALALVCVPGATALAVGARVVSAQTTPAAARPQSAMTLLTAARQLVFVTTPDWNTVAGNLRAFERGRTDSPWNEVTRVSGAGGIAIVVGKSGTAWDPGMVGPVAGPVKTEGDGRSPAGVFALGAAFGFAPPADAKWLKLPYLEVTPTLECVDDPASRAYNTVVDRKASEDAWTSSEKMHDISPAYHWGVVVEYNTRPVVPRRGSCVFLHIGGDGGRGTAGCTAMAEPALKSVMQWLDPTRAPVLVQLPVAARAALQTAWGLPGMPATPR